MRKGGDGKEDGDDETDYKADEDGEDIKKGLVHLEAHGHIVLPQQEHVLPELFIPLALEGQG